MFNDRTFKIAHEIELRGPLTKSNYVSLSKFLRKNGKFIEHRMRNNFMFDHPNKQIDLRVRSTNQNIEMTLKVGHIAAHQRKEISFKLGKVKLEDALHFLFHLGFRKGAKSTVISDIYRYSGVEFVVAEIPNHSYYFEIEGLAKSKGDILKVKKRLFRIIGQLDLEIFTKETFVDYIGDIQKNANKRFVLKS